MRLLQRLLVRLAPYRWRDTVAELLEDERLCEARRTGREPGLAWLLRTARPIIGPLWWAEVRSRAARFTGLSSLQISTEFRSAARRLRESPVYAIGLTGSLGIAMAIALLAVVIADAAYLQPNATGTREGFYVLIGAGLLVFVLACLNASNLTLASLAERATQWRLRIAIGASRWDLTRQKLVEDTLTTVIALPIGCVLAALAFPVVRGSLPLDFRIDYRTFSVTLVVALIVPPLFGLLPALPAIWRLSYVGFSGRVSRRRSRAFGLLIACQCSIALGFLLPGTELLTALAKRSGDHGIQNLEHVSVVSFRTSPSPERSADLATANHRLAARIREEFPNSVVGISCECELWRPLTESASARVLAINSEPASARVVAVLAGAQFLEVVSLRIVEGRGLAGETGSLRSVVVNTAFLRQFGPAAAVGSELKIQFGYRGPDDEGQLVRIVGVVTEPVDTLTGRAAVRRLDQRAAVFYPMTTDAPREQVIYVRHPAPLRELAGSLGSVLQEFDNLTITHISSLASIYRGYEAPRRWVAHSVSAAGLISLLLALTGIYSLVAYQVSRSKREIMIRIALGSSSAAISTMFARRALYPVLAGGATGIVVATATLSLLRPVFGVSITVVLPAAGGAAVLLMTLMLFAGVLPTLQTLELDPTSLLKAE